MKKSELDIELDKIEEILKDKEIKPKTFFGVYTTKEKLIGYLIFVILFLGCWEIIARLIKILKWIF